MKKEFFELLEEMSSEELAELLEGTQLADKVGQMRIRQRVRKALPGNRRKLPKWVTAVAACLALVFTLGACALEAKEYQTAVTFFDVNCLSTEGLSRWEVKAVYRDITTESYSYSKTAEVIGVEISQNVPTPEQIEMAWQNRNDTPEGIRYEYHYVEKMDEKLGFTVHDRSDVSKYDGETLLWTVGITDFQVWGVEPVTDGVLIYGDTPTWSSQQKDWPWIAMASENGELLWQQKLDNGFKRESIEFVLDNGDGTFAVLSRGDLKYFCLSQFDKQGQRLSFRKTEIGNYGIWNAARLGDGYLVQIGNYSASEYARILQVDRDGSIREEYSYKGEDSYYFLSDMVEFGGRVYLSAYAVPALEDPEENAGGRYEIAGILYDIYGKNQMGITSEELTPMLQAHYTALLLVCDAETGTPREFYSVDGSLGGELAVDENGQLLWDVKTIVTTYFSPYTSAFSIGGTCAVFRYSFDEAGVLVDQKDTGELAYYAR